MRRCALVLACVVAAGVTPAEAAMAPRYGGTLTVALPEAPTSLDPAHLRTLSDRIAAAALFDTLFVRGPDGAPTPHLVHRHTRSEDGLTITFWLEPLLRFHDGGALSSRDVVASWTRLLNPRRRSPHAWLLSTVKGAERYRAGAMTKVQGFQVLNDLCFRVRLSRPDPLFLHRLTALPLAVVPAGIDRRRRAFATQPLGSGPFRFRGFEADGALALESWSEHPRGRPLLDGIRLVPPGPRPVDLAVDRSARVIGRTRTVETGSWRAVMLEPGARLDLGSLPVREAIFGLLDREALRERFGRGRTEAAPGLLPFRGIAERSVPAPRIQKSRARAVLLAAELPSRVVLLVRRDPAAHARLAETLGQTLREEGLRIELDAADPLGFVRSRNLELMDLTVATLDPFAPESELIAEQVRSWYGVKRLSALGRGLTALPLYREASCLEGRVGLQGLEIRADGTIPFEWIWIAPDRRAPAMAEEPDPDAAPDAAAPDAAAAEPRKPIAD